MSSKFFGKVQLSPVDSAIYKISIEFDKDAENLFYDDVYDALYDEMEKKYPEEYYPAAKLLDIFIETLEDDKYVYYPVVGDEKYVKDYNALYSKVLVLPCYTYSLSDEYILYSMLIKHNVININKKFEYNLMHELLHDLKNKICHE